MNKKYFIKFLKYFYWELKINFTKKKYKKIYFIEQLTDKYSEKINNYSSGSCSLDLGCGIKAKNPFNANHLFGVDIRNDLQNNIKEANLANESIPFPNNKFDYCTAFNFLEHIPRPSWDNGKSRSSFIELMNEIYRVLKPGGIFLHVTPAFPSPEAFQDPTHVNIITENTFPCYFCNPNPDAKNLGYGFTGDFELIDQRWLHNTWIVGLLKANKISQKDKNSL